MRGIEIGTHSHAHSHKHIHILYVYITDVNRDYLERPSLCSRGLLHHDDDHTHTHVKFSMVTHSMLHTFFSLFVILSRLYYVGFITNIYLVYRVYQVVMD